MQPAGPGRLSGVRHPLQALVTLRTQRRRAAAGTPAFTI
jgi:hypothetical protein